MKIWIDFINTPQVSFWVPFIREFKKDKHEVILTYRDSGNTIALLEQNDLDYTVIGKKWVKACYRKLCTIQNDFVRFVRF